MKALVYKLTWMGWFTMVVGWGRSMMMGIVGCVDVGCDSWINIGRRCCCVVGSIRVCNILRIRLSFLDEIEWKKNVDIVNYDLMYTNFTINYAKNKKCEEFIPFSFLVLLAWYSLLRISPFFGPPILPPPIMIRK